MLDKNSTVDIYHTAENKNNC